jgi:hypothetical protein
MQSFGRAAVSDFLGDFMMYRNLSPVDERLPNLGAVHSEVGLEAGRLPRKTEPEYARAVAYILKKARALDAPGTRIEQLVFLGDTRLLDATALSNLCLAENLPGIAFIGSEASAPAKVEILPLGEQQLLYASNRWAALYDFDRFCLDQGFGMDERTAILVDLDKTAVGARGRNAQVIDRARVQAVRETVAGLLGEAFDAGAFQSAYDTLNQPEFHPFTADNQDYLAYICLILVGGLYSLDRVVDEVRAGRLASFEQFIQQVDARGRALPPELAQIHAMIYANVRAGDPTPFKDFRYNEYRTTIARMGFMADDTAVEALLAEEITITREVWAMAKKWRAQGALLFGLSDKPDEASCPTPDLAAQGYQPIHRTPTHSVGTE